MSTKHRDKRLRQFVLCSIPLMLLCSVAICWTPLKRLQQSAQRSKLLERFQFFSSVQLPNSASIIAHEDGERNWNGDGHFTMVIEVNDADLNVLLQSSPFGGPWQDGPVPNVIKDHFMEGEFKRTAPWSAPDATYTAQNRGPQSMPWHNGRIFIVDRNARRVWFGEYDF